MRNVGFTRHGIWFAVLALAIFLHHSAAAAENGEAGCAGLAQHDFSSDVGAAVTIGKAEFMQAGALPAFCKVSAVIAPAVRVEIRLPATDWKSRFLFAGCGGLCGVLQTEAANDALARGYATATTDMGHEGSGAEWLDDKAAVEDFMYRATHVSAILGKAVFKAYYGHGQDHAYYRGCSTGGRQGLMEALRYPDDFDGIIAGAPASYPGVPVELWDRKVNRTENDNDILDEAAFALLHEAAVAKCDPVDGVKDGLIGNPLGCKFDPGKLQCGVAVRGAGGHGKCLTPEQVTVARKLYSGPVSQGKKFTTLGMAPGGEMGVAANVAGVDGKPAGIETVLVHYAQLVLGKTATWRNYNFDADIGKQSPTEAIPGYGADGKALAPFAAHGKLLIYSGWNDPLVSPTIPIDFYRKNAAVFGPDVAGFLRLFMMPGMGHCRGGDGPDAADWLTAMEDWVEEGKAPQSIVSYKTSAPPQGQQAYRFPLPAESIVFARPLFPFPSYAQYGGQGAVTDPASFVPGTVTLQP